MTKAVMLMCALTLPILADPVQQLPQQPPRVVFGEGQSAIIRDGVVIILDNTSGVLCTDECPDPAPYEQTRTRPRWIRWLPLTVVAIPLLRIRPGQSVNRNTTPPLNTPEPVRTPQPITVPEPAMLFPLGLGLLFLAARHRKPA